MAPDLLAGAGELEQLGLGRVRGGLDPVAELAVDLDDQGDGVAGRAASGSAFGQGSSQTRLAGQALVDLGAEVRREGEDQRGRGRGREADGAPAPASP